MKVLIVTPYFFPKIGGLENYVYYSSLSLLKNAEHEIVAVTSKYENKQKNIEIINGIKVYRLDKLLKISNTPVNPWWFFEIIKIVKIEQPNLISAHTPVPFIADVASVISKLLKIPFVVTYHAGGLSKGQRLSDFITTVYAQTVEKLMLNQAHKIIVLNEFVKKTTLKKYKDKVSFIRPGVTLPPPIKNKEKVLSNRVLFVGNLDRTHAWKGLETLLYSMVLVHKRKPYLRLDIVGGGDNIKFYKDLVSQLNISDKVLFHGEVQNNKVPEYYVNADLLVLPSHTDAESLGLVVLEAMSYGLPIVASDVGGLPYIVRNNENGLLVKPYDDKALAKALITIFDDKKLHHKFSNKSYELSKQYNWKDHVRALSELFEKVTNEK